MAHDQRVDRRLRDGEAESFLAGGDQQSVGARKGEDIRAHQPVMDHHIRRLDQAQRAQREQIGPAGACADKGDGGGVGRERAGHGERVRACLTSPPI